MNQRPSVQKVTQLIVGHFGMNRNSSWRKKFSGAAIFMSQVGEFFRYLYTEML